METSRTTITANQSAGRNPRRRPSWPPRDERGEGVISTAIAVLIVALLGVALWIGFSTMMGDAAERTSRQVEQIGG